MSKTILEHMIKKHPPLLLTAALPMAHTGAPSMAHSSVMPPAVADSRVVVLGSYNIGLTSKMVYDEKTKNRFQPFYKKSGNLEKDLTQAFFEVNAQLVFLCELGSQHSDKSLDIDMKQRFDYARGDGAGKSQADMEYCDTSKTVEEWLRKLLHKINLTDFALHCQPPYAAIWISTEVNLRDTRLITSVAGPQCPERKAIVYQFEQVHSSVTPPAEDTGLPARFKVALNHSPN